MFKKVAIVTIVAGFVVGVAATSSAQSEAPAASRSSQEGPALGGYCPVAYAAMNQAVKGDPRHSSQYAGHSYLFANAEAKQMFDAEPAKYLPAYEGYCATAVAQGMKLESDPQLFTVHDGRTYLFSNAEAKTMFDRDTTGIVAKADSVWPSVSQAR